MQITDIRIRKVEKEGKMKAVVSITIDDEFVVHDIKAVSYTHLDVYKRQILSYGERRSLIEQSWFNVSMRYAMYLLMSQLI